jgi:hypothetical protein
MGGSDDSRVIYGDAPFIADMRLLTSLCLLNDKVILVGTASLHEQLEKNKTQDDVANSVISQTVDILIPEGVVWFVSPSELENHFPGAGDIGLCGIEGVESTKVDGEHVLGIRIKPAEMNDITRSLLRGFSSDRSTVSVLIRDLSILAASVSSGLPIVCQKALITPSASSSRVPEIAGFLAQRIFERLVFPELEAYHVEDILEARLKLNSELQQFRAGIRELVWLLHQRMDISGDITRLAKECDILIETKIWAAVSNLERAIAAHESNTVRRILKTVGGALLEMGKSLVSPTIAGVILGGSGALLKVAEGLEASPPAVQIASFIYKVRKKSF